MAKNKGIIGVWEQVSSEFMSWSDAEVGATLEGKLHRSEIVSIKGEAGVRHTIRTDHGDISYNAPYKLADLMQEIKLGSEVRIVSKGMIKAGAFGRLLDFDVFIRPVTVEEVLSEAESDKFFTEDDEVSAGRP